MERLRVADVRALLGACETPRLSAYLEDLADDGRPGVVAACTAARERLRRHEEEMARLWRLEEAERSLWALGIKIVAGVDEVGRGALAGPVSAAACVLPKGLALPGLDDSKRLRPERRAELDSEIREAAVAVSVAHVPAEVIDATGIANATAEAIRSAIAGLTVPPDHVLVDGLPVYTPCPQTAVVRGDGSVRVIAAASIVAKVARDALMADLDAAYPGYGLAGNKGYGSREHLAAIEALGPSTIHRRSFAPCSQRSLFEGW